MRIKVFGKKDCAKCETTKNKFNHFLKKNQCQDDIKFDFYDMDTIDGMAEGAYDDVFNIPVTIIEKDDKVLARWDGKVPKTEEFSAHFEEFCAKV
ncbi:thioredoxin family protein [Candidatus Omnitrophota bacterium]